MLMPQSDWLSFCTVSAIGVLWLEVIYEMVMICTMFSKTKDLWQEHYFGKNNVIDHFHILGMVLELAWSGG